MKSENHIIVGCKEPIKIEKPLQCLLPFSYSIGERNMLQTVLLSLFPFLFPRCLTALAKISLNRAQNIFMPANMNSFVLV